MTVLADGTETGALGIFQLKRIWSRAILLRLGQPVDRSDSWLDHLVIHAVGLGLEQTLQYLLQAAPSFEEFERWILDTTGGVAARQVDRINATVCGAQMPVDIRQWLDGIEASDPVLTAEDLQFWNKHGYVILHDAISTDACKATAQATLDFIGAKAGDPESWYPPNPNGIMVQLFQHAALQANRQSPRIHKAFAQLWGHADLWMTTDRVGFNAPERPGNRFRGPDLHWDVSLQQPMPFGTQGILYLTDTTAEQGALTLVPGFHRRIGDWLESLLADADPRQQDLHGLGSTPLPGRAGDLIIWHQALPHGSRPNRTQQPRVVQYINMYPARPETHDIWR